MGVDVPFYYFDNYEETIDAFKDYILHQDSQYWQLATAYGKSLESFSIEIDSSLVSIWKHVASRLLYHIFICPQRFSTGFHPNLMDHKHKE